MAQTGEEANFVTKPALKMKKPTGKPIGGESKMVELVGAPDTFQTSSKFAVKCDFRA